MMTDHTDQEHPHEAGRPAGHSTGMPIVAISGATGLVGRAVARSLADRGWKPVTVTRRPRGPNDIEWDPQKGFARPAALEGLSAFIHLAGESIASGRWTAAFKDRIRSSRIDGTRTVAETLAGLEHRPPVLICASAIGYYGDRGDERLDESSSPGHGFLAEVCRDWEAAADPARACGIRVVHLRIGVVLSRHGGALTRMLLPFRLGLGGRVGSGRQYWSWVSLDDICGTVEHVLNTPSLSGSVNCVVPQAPTNQEFTQALGSVLHRPVLFPMPAFAARMVLGEMANELLLASTRVVPRRLTDTGYTFRQPDLKELLKRETS